MDLQKLSNQELLKLAKEKSSNERAITLEVIKLIREVERRRLFLDLGYGSLFDYVTGELKYVESAALKFLVAHSATAAYIDGFKQFKTAPLRDFHDWSYRRSRILAPNHGRHP